LADSVGGGADYARIHIWQIQAVRDILFVGAVVGVLWLGYVLRAVTVPLLVALLLAYLFEPILERVTKHPKISRPVAVGGLLAIVGTVVLSAVALLVPLAVGQTLNLIGDIREGRFAERVSTLERFVPEAYRDDFDGFLEVLPRGERVGVGEGAEDAASKPGKPEGKKGSGEVDAQAMATEGGDGSGGDFGGGTGGWDWVGKGADTIAGVIGRVVQVGMLSFLIPFYFFFFSVWYPGVVRFGRNLLPEKNKGRTLELLEKMDRAVAGFVRGRIVISIIMGVMLAVGWAICGVKFSIALGLVIGVFCAVPYLGAIGVPLAIGLLFYAQLDVPVDERMAWWGVLLWPSLVFGVVQLIEAYALTPMIAGKATNLDPVTIIVAVLAGGSVLGIYGMLLAIPLAACGKILFTEVLMPRIHDWAAGRAADPLPIDRD